MIELFNNIGAWINEHSGAIFATVQSIDIGAMVAVLWNLYKSRKLNKEIKHTADDMSDIKSEVTTIGVTNTNVNKIATSQKELEENVVALTVKVNALLAALTLVYSTIKDDNIRTNVNTILTTASLSEKTKIKELQEKITQLQNVIDNKLESTKEEVKTVVEDVNSVLTDNIPLRG